MARKMAGMYKDKNGLYSYRFTIDGKRYAVYGRTPDECKEKEQAKRQQIKEGTYKRGKDQSLSEYFEKWEESKRDSVKETTLRTQRVLFSAMAAVRIDDAGQTFGSMKLSAIETENIRTVQAALKKERKTRTVNDSISLVRGMLQSAVNERILTWNPAAGIRSLKRTEPAARDTTHRALSIAETKAFMESARKRNSWYCNLYTFLLHTGCRIGEAGALLPGDIDKHGVRIRRTVTRTENGGYMIGSETKTAAGRRFIPLDKEAAKVLHDQKAVNAAFNGDGMVHMDKPVFTTPYGSILKSTNVNQDIERVCRAAGIERFTVHAFRDTFATRCVESGMQPKVLQDIMGHSDISMTMNLYAHSMEESKMDQLKVVNFG